LLLRGLVGLECAKPWNIRDPKLFHEVVSAAGRQLCEFDCCDLRLTIMMGIEDLYADLQFRNNSSKYFSESITLVCESCIWRAVGP